MSPYVPATTPYPWPYDGDLDGAGGRHCSSS